MIGQKVLILGEMGDFQTRLRDFNNTIILNQSVHLFHSGLHRLYGLYLIVF